MLSRGHPKPSGQPKRGVPGGCPALGCPKTGRPGSGCPCWAAQRRRGQKALLLPRQAAGAVRERPVSSWELVGPAQPRSHPPRGPKRTAKCPANAINPGGSAPAPPPRVARGYFHVQISSIKQTWDTPEPKLPRPELGSPRWQQGQGLRYQGLILPCPCPAPLLGSCSLPSPFVGLPFCASLPKTSSLSLGPQAAPGTPKSPLTPLPPGL